MWAVGQRRQQALVAARVRAVVEAHAAEMRMAAGTEDPLAGIEDPLAVGDGAGEHRDGSSVDDGFLGLSDAELTRWFAEESAPEPAARRAGVGSVRAPAEAVVIGPVVPVRHPAPDPVAAPAGPVRPEEPAAGDVAAPSLIARLLDGRPVQAAPGRRGAIAVGVAAMIAAVVTGWWVFASRPQTVGAPAAASSGSLIGGSASPGAVASAASASLAPPASAPVLVDVEGKVRRPGLYRLPSGSRVADALRAAGGARPHVSTVALNLAARLTDGQQIVVGAAAPPVATGGGAPTDGATSPASAPVSLNSASLDQLETLPGVGPVLAQHILDWRSQHGGFASVDQLNDVSGIGDITFANLKDLVTL